LAKCEEENTKLTQHLTNVLQIKSDLEEHVDLLLFEQDCFKRKIEDHQSDIESSKLKVLASEKCILEKEKELQIQTSNNNESKLKLQQEIKKYEEEKEIILEEMKKLTENKEIEKNELEKRIKFVENENSHKMAELNQKHLKVSTKLVN